MAEQRIRKGMMERKKDLLDDFKLRQLAEKKLDRDSCKTEMSPENTASQLHELQVHQVELKMQNDELRRLHKELEESRDNYPHLYDFAPIGYFTMTEKGVIDEVNLTLASMLEVTRTDLIGQPFSRFIPEEDQTIFYKHWQRLIEREPPHSCDLRLMKKGGDTFYARLECVVVKSKERDLKQIRVTVDNITESKQIEMELKQKASELEDMNTALKVLLKRREEDKNEIEEKIFANYQLLLTPNIQDLKKTLTQKKQQEIIKVLELNLKNILSPFSKKLSDKMIHLTPTEIQVADLIKLGKSNKEISIILNSSVHTISRHRDNIRVKTGLKNKKINLRSFLLSL